MLLALGNVPVHFQDGKDLALGVAPKRLAALDDHLGTIFARLNQFSFPLRSGGQEAIKGVTGLGKLGLEQIMAHKPHGLLAAPAIQTLSTLVPEDNPVHWITHNNGIIG
jgi:hypothetical protein